MTTTEITVKGAREHNLCDVSLTLPRGQLICFSGVSGSGKSSLAFDTLYAEGQRRYVESLSNYARQFMGQMPKPDVDLVSGLSPSISISQKSTGNNPRSTVGTITEIYDFLRVLYARVGTGHCPSCNSPITAQSRDAITSRILSLPSEATVWILAPLVRGQKGEFRDLFEDLRKQGFTRARVDGETIRLSEPPTLDRNSRHEVEVVVDRVEPEARDRGRITEAVENGLKLGEATLIVSLSEIDDTSTSPVKEDILYSSKYSCNSCGRSFKPPTPQLFSFNSPQGMCGACDGLGRLYTFVPDLLVPDQNLSVRKGAIVLLGKWGDLGRYRRHIYKGVADALDEAMELDKGTMLEAKWCDLPPEARQIWLWGTDDEMEFTWKGGRKAKKYSGEFDGFIPELVERYKTSKNKMQLRQFEKYMATLDCPDCHGKRLNEQASAVCITGVRSMATAPQAAQASPSKVGDAKDGGDNVASTETGASGSASLTLPELCELPVDELAEFFSDITLGETEAKIASEALKEIRARIGFLLGVGLEYLTLGRTAPTLSGGESQRIRLAGQIGSGLVGVLYILDEPSIGLHPRDNDRLIETLERLRDTGNTLIVVEHDEDTMRASDLIVDFGPGPGVKGGRIVASGTIDDVMAAPKSVTGQFLSGTRSITPAETLRPIDPATQISVRGARFHNLKNVDVDIPLGVVVCVTGVSGSGKSSLIGGILEPALRNALNGAEQEIGDHDSISGLEHLDKTIAIDQSPIGRTPRSNPATYVKVFDEIRNLYAKMSEAKTRGYTASRFSFNVDGGRCAACDGNGATKLEMDFLADIWVTCPICQGRRYNRETLSVQFKGASIADVLEMDISQALKLFKNIPKIAEKLQTLVDVGLEYLKLGQPSPTLSGGEAQRIKLSRELSKRETGKTLYVLDEPTTGLHFADIEMLLGVIHRLADRGNTIVIVEHNTDVIKTADWVIDLGPEGGFGGGRIIAQGRPAEVATVTESYTGAALAKSLGIARKSPPKPVVHREIAQVNPRARTHVVVEAACEHNLKSVDVEIPRDAMTVFCGPSGSGKSSMAMDTIYAEGQRRYVESLSSYARQFIGQVQKPRVDRIEGLSPAVALEQKNLGHSPRSTVGTVTEVYDYLRILMARLGTMHCPDCQVPVGTQTPDQIVDKVMAMTEGTRALLMAPIDVQAGEAAKDTWQSLRSTGYQRIRIDGVTMGLDSAPALDPRKKQVVQVVVDRIVVQESDRSRISDSVEQALSLGIGVLEVAIADDDRDEHLWKTINHSQHLVCGCCGRSFGDLTPHHFSFNSAVGWCPSCEGLGTQTGTNPAALIGLASQSLCEGVALLWPSVDQSVSVWMLKALSRHTGIRIDVPYDELTVTEKRTLYRGTGPQWIEVRHADTDAAVPKTRSRATKKTADANSPVPDTAASVLFRFQFKGFYPALEEASRLTPGLRGKLEAFTDEIDCGACDGSRLREEAAAVRFRQRTIADFVHMPLDRLAAEVKSWSLDRREKKIAGELVREVESRVRFLLDVGLNYLTLHRGASTLSGGEAQRIRLAGQLGSGLCGVLYVLDEPTIGLHPRDNLRLLGALHRLRDQGNTLLVVEHDHDVIGGSDYLCDFGPLAGRNGGRIVARGTPDDVQPIEDSVTAGYVTGTKVIPVPPSRRPVTLANGQVQVNQLRVIGAREHNLKNVDFELPLGTFTAVTGPSGSGKSSMIDGILYPVLARRLHRARLRPGRHEKVEGVRYIDKVIEVDQSPLGNTPSSNPATYTGVFDLIRNLFALIPEAAERKFTARTFSFNVPGGRCETCEGSGQLKIEMHFLPDVWVPCEDCQSRRYRDDVLEVKFHGRSIADVLDMQIGDAVELFASDPKIQHILQTICDVGLDYVTLGQSAPTLSGGEAQRVKLAAELARPVTGNTLYLLDEPTTGLHFDDIEKLLGVLQRLVDLGNTVVVIEHNLDVIKCADWIIDMGPGAGVDGGRIVFAGTPEDLAATAKSRRKKGDPPVSLTAPFLAEALQAAQNVVDAVPVPGSQTAKSDVVESPSAVEKRAEEAEVLSVAEPLVADRTDEGPENAERNDAEPGDRGDADSQTDQPAAITDPWKVLGRKWHSLRKGFPAGQQPSWPLEIVDGVLKLMEQVAGDNSLDFASPTSVTVKPQGADRPWAEVDTKTPDSLKVTLAGPSEAIEMDGLPPMPVDGPVAVGEFTVITLNLTEAKHVRSRKLRSFLKSHLERSTDQ
ncbi:UvrABC system protein A [Rubripirellula lacrimiformis]|uniref:UvrABC system protein A n=1 Tax=Rubripirellula lacrimiformis TaxID=1930273 RepID=A0A517NH36_9BACT|nr:excinuclease ABC subunit UvrA [Rubripirellula lacrimiformis]QDT06442.1 UvrABC system protein A [Rubripirellula lacrimiformis]